MLCPIIVCESYAFDVCLRSGFSKALAKASFPSLMIFKGIQQLATSDCSGKTPGGAAYRGHDFCMYGQIEKL